MNEYNDAIQRLEMPERPPGTTIRRSMFPIPKKNTPWNYNYIFRNTGNMNIPKYSIPQQLIIINHNTRCISTQKSELDKLVESLQTEISTYETYVSNTKSDVNSKQAEYDFAVLALDDENAAQLLTELQELQEKLNNYELELKRLNNQLEEYQSELTELENDGKTTFDFPLDQQFTLAHGNRKSIAIRAVNIEA